ncbi:MAG TPA: TonB C-terminal domain-containing protein [Myxococcota bacterium]|nr:TonB C-terminal domain-containing protein [Myxococcota bacterium]
MAKAPASMRPDGPDRRTTGFALGATIVVHLALAGVLATAGGPDDAGAVRFPGRAEICDGIRCAEKPYMKKRRGPDSAAAVDVGMIEATIIPRLGLAEPRPGALPKLVKYEQPEKIEQAVNVAAEPVKPDRTPVQDARAKKAEVDRRRKDTLNDILGAPEDDDPRKRPTELSRIVGSPDGSVHGSGTEFRAGNVYAGKVSLALRQQFTVPPFLTDADLKRLRVRIKVARMNAAGQILAYEIVENSADARFNAAALQAVRRFVPKDGGSAYLPAPDEKTLAFINERGMVIDLDGALFRR